LTRLLLTRLLRAPDFAQAGFSCLILHVVFKPPRAAAPWSRPLQAKCATRKSGASGKRAPGGRLTFRHTLRRVAVDACTLALLTAAR
jgi:hypothetical protein